MYTYLTKSINLPINFDDNMCRAKLCTLLGCSNANLVDFFLHKQSVDARKKHQIHFVCSFVVHTTCKITRNATPYNAPQDYLLGDLPQVANPQHVVVVGSGPAGLYAATYLAKSGHKVTLIERGSHVSKRSSQIAHFNQTGELNENSNIQFGHGGAGTFSDGKLTTGISSPLTHTVFSHFVRHGAPQQIMYSNLPHIGTDNLVKIVDSMVAELQRYGATVLFDTLVTDFVVENDLCKGVVVQSVQNNHQESCSNQTYNLDGQTDTQTTQKITADKVILACGHSARDVFHNLVKHNCQLQFKPFAVGLRVEHPREFINYSQYGPTHKDLPSASYKLVHKCDDGHGCYSFCMCPGGTVVCASSSKNTVVVNGMSNFARNEQNSNSAIVVTVNQQDLSNLGFGDDLFAGVRFQEHLESTCFNCGYQAPAQNVVDFIANKPSTQLEITPSYPRGTVCTNLRTLLPKFIGDCIAEGLLAFDSKIKGFATSGVLTAVESRTSSPIRIVRDNETYQSNIANLYPIGEGAGYAGGIVSSAVDGLRVAMSICK